VLLLSRGRRRSTAARLVSAAAGTARARVPAAVLWVDKRSLIVVVVNHHVGGRINELASLALDAAAGASARAASGDAAPAER